MWKDKRFVKEEANVLNCLENDTYTLSWIVPKCKLKKKLINMHGRERGCKILFQESESESV
jgi:hypothetical protein